MPRHDVHVRMSMYVCTLDRGEFAQSASACNLYSNSYLASMHGVCDLHVHVYSCVTYTQENTVYIPLKFFTNIFLLQMDG